MRILLLTGLSLAAACESSDGGQLIAAEGERIECRIGASTTFEDFCRIEQPQQEGSGVITIRKPDGGFRRLRFVDDGRGVVAADGAEAAIVTIVADNRIDVAVGSDNFRLPATIRR